MRSPDARYNTHSLLSLLCAALPIVFFSILLITFAILFAFTTFLLLLAIIICQATQQLARLRRNTIHAVRIDLHTSIQRTTRFLEIHTVAFFQQRHIMKIVNQRKIPRVRRVDLVVRRHLHPLFEISQNRHALHGRHRCASDVRHVHVAVILRGRVRTGAYA